MTLPTPTFKRASLLECAVMAFVCPVAGKVTVDTLARKSARLVDRDVYFAVYIGPAGAGGRAPAPPRVRGPRRGRV